MTLEKINKIVSKAKQMRFEASRGYNNGISTIPYEQLIVVSKEYPNFIFLVNKNLHFKRMHVHFME